MSSVAVSDPASLNAVIPTHIRHLVGLSRPSGTVTGVISTFAVVTV